MKRFILILLTGFLIFSPIAFGAPNKKNVETTKKENKQPEVKEKVWEKEPTSVMGIKIGEPLEEQMVHCPSHMAYSMEFSDWKDIKEMCYDKKSEIGREIHNIQQVIPWGTSYIIVNNEVVEGIILNFHHNFYDKIKLLFIEKYGEPTSSKISEYKNMSGAVLFGETLHWQGKNIFMNIIEYNGSFDSSQIFIETKSYFSYLQDKEKNETKNILDKL